MPERSPRNRRHLRCHESTRRASGLSPGEQRPPRLGARPRREDPGAPRRRPRSLAPASDAEHLQVDRLLLQHPGGLLSLLLVVVETRPGRDELADDHVLLQAAQAVHLAADGGLGQDPGRLLEGRGGQPRGGVERRLDQASRTVWAVAGSPPSASTCLLASSYSHWDTIAPGS